jgi:hypothetical protein
MWDMTIPLCRVSDKRKCDPELISVLDVHHL